MAADRSCLLRNMAEVLGENLISPHKKLRKSGNKFVLLVLVKEEIVKRGGEEKTLWIYEEGICTL